MTTPNARKRLAWTPGPWIFEDGLVSGKDSRERFKGTPSIDIFDVANWPVELDEEARANAHLIAAAPELYEALERAITLMQATCAFIEQHPVKEYTIHYDGAECDGYCLSTDCDNAIDESMRALRKARGERS